MLRGVWFEHHSKLRSQNSNPYLIFLFSIFLFTYQMMCLAQILALGIVFFFVKWRFSNSLICISIYIYILELFSHELFIGIWKWFYFTCIYILKLFTWPYHWNLEVVLFLNWCVFSKIGYKDLSLQEIEGFAWFFILPIKPVFDLFLKLESISWKNNQSRIWLNVSEELKVLHLNWLWATHKVFDRIPWPYAHWFWQVLVGSRDGTTDFVGYYLYIISSISL